MLLPDGTVLMHEAAPYDPTKAHEYYLQYRKLHPRDKGVVDAGKDRHSYTVSESGGQAVKLSAQQLQEQKVYAAARVAAIQAKLTDLATKLQAKIAAAKTAQAKQSAPMTPAEKAAAAAATAKYRASHKQVLKNKAQAAPAKAKSATPKKADTVQSLTVDIAVAKVDLKDAVDKQRQLTTAKANG